MLTLPSGSLHKESRVLFPGLKINVVPGPSGDQGELPAAATDMYRGSFSP
jgi:hypothetical protein